MHLMLSNFLNDKIHKNGWQVLSYYKKIAENIIIAVNLQGIKIFVIFCLKLLRIRYAVC